MRWPWRGTGASRMPGPGTFLYPTLQLGACTQGGRVWAMPESHPPAIFERAALSKRIQKEMKAFILARKRAKIDRILTQFRGLKHIANIKANGKHSYLGGVLNKEGKLQNDRCSIADVFADFYADLYACREEGKH